MVFSNVKNLCYANLCPYNINKANSAKIINEILDTTPRPDRYERIRNA